MISAFGLFAVNAVVVVIINIVFMLKEQRMFDEKRRGVLKTMEQIIAELRKKNMDHMAEIFENSRRAYLKKKSETKNGYRN